MPEPRAVFTAAAPEPIGPYSQAIVSGDLVFCSGQIGLDPATGGLVGGNVAAQAERALANLEEVLRSAGAAVADVVKVTVFLTDISDFPAVNEVYAKRFGRSRPSRSTIGVSALPKGAKVEIEAIARLR